MSQQPHYILTPAGLDRIQQELNEYRARRDAQQQEMLDVQHDGDEQFPEEGAEFDARTMREWLDERIGHLELILQYAELTGEDPDPERVNIGDRVTVFNVRDREELVFDILDSEEIAFARRDEPEHDDNLNSVSADSPVGKALMGARIGDVVDVDVPDGSARYAVRSMARIPTY